MDVASDQGLNLHSTNISLLIRSISSSTKSRVDSVNFGLEIAIRKKFGKSPSG